MFCLCAALLPVASWETLFCYRFGNFGIDISVPVTFVYFALNLVIIPSSDESPCFRLCPLFSLFCRHLRTLRLQLAKTKGLTRAAPHARLACVTLYEGRLLSWIAFRACLRSHPARNSVDRSQTDLRPPPEAIQVGSIPDRSQKSANVHIQLV